MRSAEPRLLPPRRSGLRAGPHPGVPPAPSPQPQAGLNGLHVPSGRARAAWAIGFGLVGLGLLWVLRPVLAILAASASIAYVLKPMVNWLERHRLSRDAAIGVIFLTTPVILSLVLLLFIPSMAKQIDAMGARIVPFIHDVDSVLGSSGQWLSAKTGKDIHFDLEELKTWGPEVVSEQWPKVQEKLTSLSKGLFTQGLGLLNALLNIALLPIFVYYLLSDGDRALAALRDLVPPRFLPRVERVAHEVDQRLSAFVRGQLTVCSALAVLYSLGLLIVGIDLAISVGTIAGVLFIVPYLGTAVGVVLGVLLALLKFGFSWEVLGVVAVFTVVQLIEGYALTPRIIGDKVGLHPLVVMVAIIVGASLMGIWGMFLAIPITAVLSVVAAEWIELYKRSQAYEARP